MIAIIIIVLILFAICCTVFGLFTFKEDGHGIDMVAAIFVIIFGFFIIRVTSSLLNRLKVYESNIQVDLPEEIYEARAGDTLYVNERTKDTIHLGFKPLKK